MVPRNPWMTDRTRSSDNESQEVSSSTVPHASAYRSFAPIEGRRHILYPNPADIGNSGPFPIKIGNTPVAWGSKVPAWPTF